MLERKRRQGFVPCMIAEEPRHAAGGFEIRLDAGYVVKEDQSAGGISRNFGGNGLIPPNVGLIEAGYAARGFLNSRMKKPAPGARQRRNVGQYASLTSPAGTLRPGYARLQPRLSHRPVYADGKTAPPWRAGDRPVGADDGNRPQEYEPAVRLGAGGKLAANGEAQRSSRRIG